MVRLVDLNEDGREEQIPHQPADSVIDSSGEESIRPDPNFDLRFSAALSCYPVISQIARHVDLTTLHELSRTCRQFRANLLQYRVTLIEQTLRCENENGNPAARLGDALQASYQQWTNYARTGDAISRVSGGQVGTCARDMVGDCRRCGRTVCRNCVMKQPTPNVLKGRFRRVCRTCMKSSIEPHTLVTKAEEDSHEVKHYVRAPCSCDELPWICRPCGQTLRTADTTYMRGWVWRTRYSACGGIGAGLGEGNEGVECGRGEACVDAKSVEKEIECDCDELAAIEAEMERTSVDGRSWSGYKTCEIVGIGGMVKKKIKKSIKVGAIVKEYEDERVTSKFLKREQEGANRSWCSWCDRVALGKRDVELPTRSTDSVASSSSGASA